MKIRIGKGVFSKDALLNLENSAGWIVTGPPGVGKSKVLTVAANSLLKINSRTKIVVISATLPFDYDISGEFEFINGIRNKDQLFELLEKQRDCINMRLDSMNTLKTTDVTKIDGYFPHLLWRCLIFS